MKNFKVQKTNLWYNNTYYKTGETVQADEKDKSIKNEIAKGVLVEVAEVKAGKTVPAGAKEKE
jgi:hypothetical protein